MRQDVEVLLCIQIIQSFLPSYLGSLRDCLQVMILRIFFR